MKLNKLISTVLALVLVFGSVVALLPVKAEAAYSPSSSSSSVEYTEEEIKAIVTAAAEYDFASAEEMLNYELELGYLESVSSDANRYSLYVNKYTGVIYYRNNLTGEILSSNPYNPGYKKGSQMAINDQTARLSLLDQINIVFAKISDSTADIKYGSIQWAAMNSQIKVSPLRGGMRVSYTLGNTATRQLAPGQITVAKFEENLIKPMLNY